MHLVMTYKPHSTTLLPEFVHFLYTCIGAQVTVTDRAVALDLLQSNVDQNREFLHETIQVVELDWEQNLHEFADASPAWDVIIGADIVYIEETFDALLATLRHLSRKTTDIYLACKIRYDRDNKFLELMKNYFIWKKIAYSEGHDITLVHARLKVNQV